MPELTNNCPATTAALESVMNSMCQDISIPGLDLDSVLNNMADKSPMVKSALESLKNSEERAKGKFERLKGKYSAGDEDDEKEIAKAEEEMNEELRQIEESKNKAVEDFKNQFKPTVQQKINDIKMSFTALQGSIADLTATVTAALSSIPLPSFIGTGSPNPAKPVAEFITIKHQLNAQLSTVMAKAVDLCNASTDIMFDLPAPVTGVLQSLATLKQTIGSIPG